MKKILSFILAITLVFTSVAFAHAEDSNTYKVGDIIQFGTYPQSEVKDEILIAELNALTPEWEEWTSYGYYSGNGKAGSMVQGDWMRYVDIKHDGERYRGVKFTQYRPFYTTHDSSVSNSTCQSNNGYRTDTIYWFKFESIDWQVLDPNTGLVMCETIIDSQAYSNTIYYNDSASDLAYDYFNDASYEIYASDYETSSIRNWLNEDFYNIAFTDSEKKEISTTTLNNDGYFTSNGITGYENFDSNETKDKIFLLSYNEVINSDYGFNPNPYAYDIARIAHGSDYAKSQGLCFEYGSSDGSYNDTSYWLLRSPIFSIACCGISCYDGSCIDGFDVSDTGRGVRPALIFNQITNIGQHEHQHDYNTVITPPTCTAKGFTTYTCECNDSYVADYVVMLDHKDNNGNYECDYGCGYEFPKPDPEPEPEKEKNFIEKVVEWFKNIFDKLFGWMKR